MSHKAKAAFAAVAIVLLWIPTGISERQQPLVTGHSTFMNANGYDPCLASVAGILRTQVLWFNDMVLAERYGGKGTFVWLTEQGGKDPRAMNYLYSEGTAYDFVDPNGVRWHVEELFILGAMGHVEEKVEGDVVEGSPGQDPNWNPQSDLHADADASLDNRSKRQYVWTVELSERPIHDEFAGPVDGPEYHDLYNFVLLIDTCKMRSDHSQPDRVPGPGDAYNVTHDGSEPGHPIGEDDHWHDMHLADVYVSKAPVIVPFVPDTESHPTWASEWAQAPPSTYDGGDD